MDKLHRKALTLSLASKEEATSFRSSSHVEAASAIIFASATFFSACKTFCSDSSFLNTCAAASTFNQGCGSGSGGSGPFSVEAEAEAEARKFYRFHIGGKNGGRKEIGSAIRRRRANRGA